MTTIQAVKTRNGKWAVADYYDGKWWVHRTHGWAYGNTPVDAMNAAYMDNGEPDEVFKTRREALAWATT